MSSQNLRLLGIAILVGAMLYAIGLWLYDPQAEMSPEGPAIVSAVALLILLLPNVLARAQGGGEILKAILLWGGLGAVLIIGYQWREPIQAMFGANGG